MNRQLAVALVAVTGGLCWQSAAQAAVREAGRFGGARAAQWRERMQEGAKDLNLTEDQKAKLRAVYQPQMEKLREIWKDQGLTREQKLEKFKALRTENEPKLKEILTPGQREQMQQRQTQARERMESAKKEWNITDEQKAKLQAILKAQMEKLRDLRQNSDLTPQEKMEKMKACARSCRLRSRKCSPPSNTRNRKRPAGR